MLALTIFIAIFFSVGDGVNNWVIAVNLGAFYLLFARAIARPDRLLQSLPTYLTIEALFLAFSYLIFYYPYQLYLLGALDLGTSRFVNHTFVDGTNKAITLSTVGMIAFTLGYRSLRPRVAEIHPEWATSKESESHTAPNAYVSATALGCTLVLFGLITLYLLAGWRSAGEGRYTRTTTEGLGVEGVAVAILMLCMMIGALWVYSVAYRIRTPPVLYLGLFISLGWTFRLLLFGDRNSFLLFALVLVAGYFTFVHRSSLLVITAGFISWMFIYNAIEILRFNPNWYKSGDILGVLFNTHATRGQSSESSFNITAITLRATVEAVPDPYAFTYGTFKLIQLSSVVPFSGKLFLPQLAPQHITSAQLLGDVVLGPRAGYDPGTNVISDSFIDFGVPGVVIILFLIGLIAKAIRNYVAVAPTNPHRVVMYLLTLALFAELPRYAIDLPVRVLSWALIFSVVTTAILGNLSRARSPLRRNDAPDSEVGSHRLVGGSHVSREQVL